MIEAGINYLLREYSRNPHRFTRRDGIRALTVLGFRSAIARTWGELVARQANHLAEGGVQ